MSSGRSPIVPSLSELAGDSPAFTHVHRCSAHRRERSSTIASPAIRQELQRARASVCWAQAQVSRRPLYTASCIYRVMGSALTLPSRT
jgi:hypothetical protein